MNAKSKLFLLIALLTSHSLYSQCTNCGSFTYKQKIFDSSLNDFKPARHERDVRILYKDSIAIIPRTMLHTSYMNGVETKIVSGDIYFTYVDLHVKPYVKNGNFCMDSTYENKFPGITFYEYPAFSKDSMFHLKYYNLDTAWSKAGYFFFLEGKKITYEKPIPVDPNLVALTDTTIDGITYKRQKLDVMAKREKQPTIYDRWIQIDYIQITGIENWMLVFISNKHNKWAGIGTRIDYTVVGRQPWYSQQYEFISGLTKEELEVFAAWEKNAKENPVTGKEKY